MYQIDFDTPISVYFMGIGGISMSGLAEVLLSRGFKISGSDMKQSTLTKSLEQKGALVHYGQRAENITDDIDLIVYTAAISSENPEYQAAQQKQIPMMTRADLLGQIMKNYTTPIAISGTHGKTTTTSMVSEVLLAGNLDPTLSIGGILKSIGGNIRVGTSDYFVTEACEYTNSFLSFFPKISIIWGPNKVFAAAMAMPETSIHKNDGFIFWQHNVRRTGKPLIVFSIAKSLRKQIFAYHVLRFCVFTFYL